MMGSQHSAQERPQMNAQCASLVIKIAMVGEADRVIQFGLKTLLVGVFAIATLMWLNTMTVVTHSYPRTDRISEQEQGCGFPLLTAVWVEYYGGAESEHRSFDGKTFYLSPADYSEHFSRPLELSDDAMRFKTVLWKEMVFDILFAMLCVLGTVLFVEKWDRIRGGKRSLHWQLWTKVLLCVTSGMAGTWFTIMLDRVWPKVNMIVILIWPVGLCELNAFAGLAGLTLVSFLSAGAVWKFRNSR